MLRVTGCELRGGNQTYPKLIQVVGTNYPVNIRVLTDNCKKIKTVELKCKNGGPG